MPDEEIVRETRRYEVAVRNLATGELVTERVETSHPLAAMDEAVLRRFRRDASWRRVRAVAVEEVEG
jgi:hypothetical protein